MYKALLNFKHTWYDYDGESSSVDCLVLSSQSKDELMEMIDQAKESKITKDYGDFGLMTHQCTLKSSEIFEVK